MSRPRLSPSARERWTAIGLVTLVALIAYVPLLPWLGFYRDDWYQLWAGTTLGPPSIITLFSIDRPVMGYSYAAAFSLLRDSALAWQLYALFLRWVGALGALWLFRRLRPGRTLLTTSAAVVFLVYPGFLQQPNANTFSNHLMAYAGAVLSLAATAEALETRSRPRRFVLTGFAIASVLVCWLTYEYMIGLEVLRYVLIGRAAWKAAGRMSRRWLTIFIGSAAPYLIAAAAFLFWRVFVFRATRGSVVVGNVLAEYASTPLRTLVDRAATLFGDFFETSFFGWIVPLYDRLADLGTGQIIVALLLTAVAVLAFARIARGLPSDESAPPADPGRLQASTRDLIILGIVTTLAALAPVVLAGREVRWNSAFDRYTLHATLGVAMLTVGVVWAVFRSGHRLAVIGLFLGLAVVGHQANAFHWARFWDEQRSVWWQLSWRAPALKPETVLIVNLPSQRYFEDYEVWGPANLIYAPGERQPKLAAQVLDEETVHQIEAEAKETRTMRVLIEIPRDFSKSLVVDWPTREACVHVLGAGQPEAGVTTSSLVRSAAAHSREERILASAEPARPPERIFGPEPERNWCWYFQRASLARQTGDWVTVAALGREAQALGLAPGDRSEWVPFFQAYINTGDVSEAGRLADILREDASMANQVCRRLVEEHFSNGEAFQQARGLLCDEPG